MSRQLIRLAACMPPMPNGGWTASNRTGTRTLLALPLAGFFEHPVRCDRMAGTTRRRRIWRWQELRRYGCATCAPGGTSRSQKTENPRSFERRRQLPGASLVLARIAQEHVLARARPTVAPPIPSSQSRPSMKVHNRRSTRTLVSIARIERRLGHPAGVASQRLRTSALVGDGLFDLNR